MPDPALDDTLERLTQERLRAPDFQMPVSFDLAGIISVVGLLQLAMRHPGTRGAPTAKIARAFIDSVALGLEQLGLSAHAELVRMGDDPTFDRPV